MKLLSYDHCPYCVKARMIFGLKKIPVQIENLLNDDEQTPISFIGKKMLPILIKDDGSALPESLDIIAFADSLKAYGAPMVRESRSDAFLQAWLKDTRAYHYALAMPRWVKMPLPEFATKSAVAYFTQKKELSIGPFANALERTPQLVAEAHDHLGLLNEWMRASPFLWGSDISIDDFHLFASLRVLTTCDQIRFPSNVRGYTQFMSQSTGVPLHWEFAC